MEFNINKNDLVEPALLASNVSEKRQSIPILSNVLISAAKNSIKITATDLEIEYKTTIEGAEVKKEGEVTVSARKLADLVRSIPEDTKLNFCLIDNQIEIKALKFQADLATLPASDFPSIDSSDFNSSIKISSSALADMIISTSVAMAAQDVRYYLNGCLLETKGNALCVVSTDGHRLAFTKTSIDGLKEDFRVIVPRKAVMELQKIISANNEEITLNVSQNQINVVGSVFPLLLN
jgi:DNA polymerase-3 subunit beta